MSALLDRVLDDLKSAMKARDELSLSVLRMLKSEVQKLQADKGVSYAVTDEDVQTLIRRLIKQRKEAAAQYKLGGAEDRAEAELAENVVLEKYLPKQMSSEEVEKLVAETVSELNASSPKDMGRVMGVLMPKLQGQADGNVVRGIVSRILNG